MSTPSIKVAIADDHALFRKGLAEIISGFENVSVVHEAANGEELIDYLKNHPQKPDVCTIDINMPVMNGFDTVATISKKWPKMRMLALSMYDNEFNIIKMLRSGAHGYVLKDSEPSELERGIREVVKHGLYHSDIVTGRMLHQVQDDSEKPEVPDLSSNEIQFLKLCCTELTYRDIAEQMNVSPRTVDGYRDKLFLKLDITSRTGLVIYAIREKLVEVQ